MLHGYFFQLYCWHHSLFSDFPYSLQGPVLVLLIVILYSDKKGPILVHFYIGSMLTAGTHSRAFKAKRKALTTGFVPVISALSAGQPSTAVSYSKHILLFLLYFL